MIYEALPDMVSNGGENVNGRTRIHQVRIVCAKEVTLTVEQILRVDAVFKLIMPIAGMPPKVVQPLLAGPLFVIKLWYSRKESALEAI